MRDFKAGAEVFEKLSKALQAIADAAESHPESTDAPEEIRKALGDKISSTEMENLTPLASTPEDAQTEADEKVATRTNKLNHYIEKMIGGILNG